MAEELWEHALNFLENLSEDDRDLSELYDFEDETGILARHKQLVEGMRPSCVIDNQTDTTQDQIIDIKIMFYELIKMICDFESQSRSKKSLRQIYKIEGFQHLNNRLFISKLKTNSKNIREIKNQLSKSEEIKSSNRTFNQDNIEERLKLLEKSNAFMQERLKELEKENSNLKETLNCDQNEHSFTEKVSDSKKLEELLQRENIDSKDYCSAHFEKKILELEQADLYIQETTKLMSEKIVAFESMLQISSSSNDETRLQLIDIQDNLKAFKESLNAREAHKAEQDQEIIQSTSQKLSSLETDLNDIQRVSEELPNLQQSSPLTNETWLAENPDRINADKLINPEKGNKAKFTKLNIWMKKKGKCFQCISKEPSGMNLDDYECYKLVDKSVL